MSAYSGKPRPAYRALLDAIRAGKVDAVLTWHSDRLHRSPTELEEWIEVCDPRGVGVHTVKAGPLDLATPAGRMVARQLGAVARYESEHRSERVAAKMLQIAQDGGFLGGVRPFGYKSGGMELESAEARAIAEATRSMLQGGSLRMIVRSWNEAGFTTTKAERAWTPDAVRDVLKRARNAGLLEHRGRVVGVAKWPAIVSEEEWQGVVTVLGDKSRRTSRGNTPRWLLSGIARCSTCGEGMVVGTSGTHRHPSYRCRSNERGGPRHVTRAAHSLDEFVSQLTVARLSMDDARDLFAPAAPEVDIAQVRGDLAGIDEQRTELAARLGRGEISLAMMDAANRPLLERQLQLEATLAQATIHSPLVDVVTADDVAGAWAKLDLQRRRGIVDALMSITVLPAPRGRRPGGAWFDPDSVQIEWRPPS